MLHIIFIWLASALVFGIAALVWTMLCAATAQWGEKDGLPFLRTFALSFFCTPLAGALLVLSSKPRAARPLAETATRS